MVVLTVPHGPYRPEPVALQQAHRRGVRGGRVCPQWTNRLGVEEQPERLGADAAAPDRLPSQ